LNPSTKKTFEDFESAVGTMEDGDLKKLLKSFLINAKDIKELKANIDGWYNEYMDRVTGWFKRSSRWMVAATAIVVVLAFNIDSIKLVKELWQNNALRTSLVVQAGDLVNENESGNETHGMETINVETDSGMSVNKGMMDSLKVALKGIQNQLQKIDSLRAKTKSLQLPIGWKSSKDYENKKSNISFFELVKFNIQDIYLLEVLGWLITAIALTFGAPFWFDLLARFVNTRNAGKKPEN
jgi:hypothetical protein